MNTSNGFKKAGEKAAVFTIKGMFKKERNSEVVRSRSLLPYCLVKKPRTVLFFLALKIRLYVY